MATGDLSAIRGERAMSMTPMRGMSTTLSHRSITGLESSAIMHATVTACLASPLAHYAIRLCLIRTEGDARLRTTIIA